MYFTFGSNLRGIHGAGAARYAALHHGAKYGVGVGFTGNSYAIPTKDEHIQTMPIKDIIPYVQKFILDANIHKDKTFKVTCIGCGLAGYSHADMAPLFKNSPDNCLFDEKWREYLGYNKRYWGRG